MKEFIAACIIIAIGILAIVYVANQAVTEESPNWDCTTMGNQQCGVRNDDGEWFVVTFKNGQPVEISPRGF